MHAFHLLVQPDRTEAAVERCFLETSTIGLRVREERRVKLPRELQRSQHGDVEIGTKTVRRPGAQPTAKAESDDLAGDGLDARRRLKQRAEQAALEVQRCLNCDVQTVFAAKLCIECDACIDICPVDCLTIAPNGTETDLRSRLKAPADNPQQALYVSGPLPQTRRLMVKDEDVCVHCGLCAERCPTAAWDMQKFVLQIHYAGSEALPSNQALKVESIVK